MTASTGLHHITAICSDPGQTLAFYTGFLGLRLVKRTVNFDDPSAWHFYFGDERGTPGSLMTFFGWPDAAAGHPGSGEVVSVSLAIPPGSSRYWAERFVDYGVRFAVGDDDSIVFHDPDGLALELIERGYARDLPGFDSDEVPADRAPRGIASATMLVSQPEATARVLTDVFQWREGAHATVGNYTRTRYTASGPQGIGTCVDLLTAPDIELGQQGAGSIHHIAFRATSAADQDAIAEALRAHGLAPTGRKDRSYFSSVYFREKSGVLMEIATDGPGFLVDERIETLGTALKLPASFEPMREEIERLLVPID